MREYVFRFISVGTALTLVVAPIASHASFVADLSLGSRGDEVVRLQQVLNMDSETQVASSGPGSPGNETSYFGALTLLAVKRFQNKYRSEVLYPLGLIAPTGFVGAKTRGKLSSLSPSVVSSATSQADIVIASSSNTQHSSSQATSQKPKIFSASPTYVEPGDTVTIIGENFSPTGNTVILGDGPVTHRLYDLSSSDGTTLTFTYEPPATKTMTEQDLLAIPEEYLSDLRRQASAYGLSLADLANPYRGAGSRQEFVDNLEKNGYSKDALYHYFWITIENVNGTGASEGALVHGSRKLPNSLALSPVSPFQELSSRLSDLSKGLIAKTAPKAEALVPGGGFYSLVMICTCSGAFVTINIGVGGGLFVWQPGFIPLVGSCILAGAWLGYSIPGLGICPMYAGLVCVPLFFSQPILPIGCMP